MNRNDIYKAAEVAANNPSVLTDLAFGPQPPNVEYWLLGLKEAQAQLELCLSGLRPSEAVTHWTAIFTSCCICMMQNGVVRRGMGPVAERIVVRGASTFKDAIVAVNGELAYQDVYADGRKHTEFGFAVMFDTHLRRAIDAWTNYPGDFHALDELRKLAGICVHCLEKRY